MAGKSLLLGTGKYSALDSVYMKLTHALSTTRYAGLCRSLTCCGRDFAVATSSSWNLEP